MQSSPRSDGLVYIVALAATAIAVALRWCADPWLGGELSLVTVFAATAAIVWFGGWRPALLAAIVGYLACDWFFIEPRGAFRFETLHDWVPLVEYVVASAAIIGFGEAARAARRRRRVGDQVELARSETRLRVATEVARMYTWEVDARANVLTWSANAAQVLGCSAEELPSRPESGLFFVAPEDRARVRAEYVDAAARGLELHATEYRGVGTPATAKHYRALARIEYDHAGLPLRMIGVTQDVTERKHWEEALQESEAKYRLLTEALPFSVWQTGPDGKSEFANSYLHEYAGTTPQEIRDRGWLSLAHPDDAEELLAHWERSLRTGEPIEIDHRVRRRDGEYRWFHATGVPVRDSEGRVVKWVGACIDIHDKRAAEAALRASEERLANELAATKRLHALSSRLLSTGDLVEGLADVLENAIASCGARAGVVQVLDRETGVLGIVVQRGFEAEFLEHFREARVGDGAARGDALRRERYVIEDVERDPSYAAHRDVALRAGYRAVQSTPLVTRDGTVHGVLSTHFEQPRAITEHDGRMLDLYARHAADLIERMRFEQALRDADRQKDEFLATLAHELRNPLAPICNAARIQRATQPLRPDLAWTSDVIERQAAQMARLLDDLLDVSRITRDKLVLKKRAVTLASVIEGAVETSRPAIEAGRHELSVALPIDEVVLHADPVRLAQVFANLLNNAAKFTPEGGRIRLLAELVHDTSEVVVLVEDSGIGIPKERLDDIFDTFTQLDHSLERAKGGLGIGLTLVRRLVAMHDGTVTAESEGAGRGSRFVVRMPATSASRGVEPSSENVGGARASRRKILVVEDNEDSAQSLAMLLQIAGDETRIAHDGTSALELAETYRPDVVLLDIGLPKLDGYEVARRLRARPWGGEVVLVALTGWGQEDDRKRSRAAGFDAHLVKPVDHGALASVLASATRTRVPSP